MPHPNGPTSGTWDIPSSLKCPTRPHPSFGSAPHTHGTWRENGSGKYEFECVIRANGSGATSGSGLWMLRLPREDGYQLKITSPAFDDGKPVNSLMVAVAQVGTATGVHLGALTVHTRSPQTTLESSQDDWFLVFAKQGTLFLGGSTWIPANLHVASLRPFAATWSAV